MFRKGGEVMEGIMTGITPRKMYALGPTDQGVVCLLYTSPSPRD